MFLGVPKGMYRGCDLILGVEGFCIDLWEFLGLT